MTTVRVRVHIADEERRLESLGDQDCSENNSDNMGRNLGRFVRVLCNS